MVCKKIRTVFDHYKISAEFFEENKKSKADFNQSMRFSISNVFSVRLRKNISDL